MSTSVLLLIFTGLAMLMTAVLLITSIRRNFVVGQSFRIELLDRIEFARFGKMLRKHNVEPQELLHTQPLSSIENQIRNCQDCVKTSECDRILEKPVVSDSELAFCPNSQTIIQQQAIS